MLMYFLVSIAGALFMRCVLWHVPKLALMIWRGHRTPPAYLKDYCPGCNRAPLVCNCPPIALPTPTLDYDALERDLWMRCPSAFWLDPTRATRAAWPAPPTSADLKYDQSPVDMAVAYVVLTPEERFALETSRPQSIKRIARISSERRFDRMAAPARTVSQMHKGPEPSWQQMAQLNHANGLCQCGERYVKNVMRMVYICPNCKYEEHAL